MYDQLNSQVHAWFCRSSEIHDAEKLSAYKSVLSEAELERYHKFYYEKDKHSYLISHALLRYSLSKYVDVSPSQWRFINNAHGKPALAAESALPEMYFNLTHTDGLVACVISLGRRCGIDAENIHRKNKLNAVAQRMFAEEEMRLLDEKNINSKFYAFWTLRESYVKALGTGLAGFSKNYYFDIDKAGCRAKIHHREAMPADGKNWFFELYQPTPDHVLSLGFESDDEVSVLLAEFVP